MSKVINYLYIGIIVFSAILLLYIGTTFSNCEYLSSGEISVSRLVPISIETPGSQSRKLTFKIPNTIPEDAAISFLSKHQSVEIKIEDQLVYSYTHGNNAFGHTTGMAWHLYRISKSAQGKTLTIFLHTPYSSVTFIPDIQIGSKLSLYKNLLSENLFSYTLCIFTVIIGVCLIFYWITIHKSLKQLDSSLRHLGTFSILYGLWALNESPITLLVLHNNVVSTYMAHILLMLLPIPFIMFIRNLYQNKNSHCWDFLCILSFTNLFLNIFLQVTNLADFKQTLFLTHLVLITCVISCGFFTIVEIKRHTMGKLLQLNIACSILIFFAFFSNLNAYFNSEHSHDMLIRIFFLVYIILPSWYSMKEISVALKKLEEAEFYRKMAYFDQLTKVYNRNAYSEDIKAIIEKQNIYPMVILCDLNNLKKCNDILGHDIGDQYIQDAASILRSAFTPAGKCYRIGGDEFCILMKRSEEKIALSRLEEINSNWSTFHNLPGVFQPQIAFGYAVFDPILDHDFRDTIKRADTLMYVNKKASKLYAY